MEGREIAAPNHVKLSKAVGEFPQGRPDLRAGPDLPFRCTNFKTNRKRYKTMFCTPFCTSKMRCKMWYTHLVSNGSGPEPASKPEPASEPEPANEPEPARDQPTRDQPEIRQPEPASQAASDMMQMRGWRGGARNSTSFERAQAPGPLALARQPLAGPQQKTQLFLEKNSKITALKNLCFWGRDTSLAPIRNAGF